MPDPGAFCVFLLIILASSAIPFAGTSNVAGQEFLNNNALSDGVAVLPSGLQYRVVVQGSGVETPLPNTSCLLHYEGSLIDGTVFDSSYRRGKPSVVQPRSMTKGVFEALLLMTEGARWQIALPSDLAYGDEGFHPFIKQGDAVLFDLQLLKLLQRGLPLNVSEISVVLPERRDMLRPILASVTAFLLIALPLALCIHRVILKRRNLHSLFKRADFNMPSMRATGGKTVEFSVLPMFDASGITSPKADHQA